VILLIPSLRFLPRRRPQTARDALPLRSLVELLLFWTLLALGGLFITVAAMELYAHFVMGVPIDRTTKMLMLLMAAAAPVCFAFALRFWARLRR
jgi:hypothetical protein